jgi:hypothetical protein
MADQLRELLRQQVQSATAEAIRSDGQVSAEQAAKVERLAHLVDLYQAAQPSPVRRRWPLILALGGTLLIVSALLFARVPETEIELDLALSEVSFVSPTQQVLTESLNLSSLGVSGLEEIQIPSANHDFQTTRPSEERESALRLSVDSRGKRSGSITLTPMVLPVDVHVWVRRSELPQQYRLSLEGANTEISVGVNGPVRLGFSHRGAERRDFIAPDGVLLKSGGNEVDLDLVLLDPAKSQFSSQLLAKGLSFLHIDEFRDPNNTVVRRVSTIILGNLTFESLNGLEQNLHPGEMIQFEYSRGEIRTLRLQEDKIDLKFHGRVRGMSIGSDESRRSLMPTWLDWLRARHSLSLLWGTAFYLFGLIAGALRWWRQPI